MCRIDITAGKENVRVSAVNSVDPSDRVPPFVEFEFEFEYATKRKPGKGVVINTKADFLICCDCTDDCQDKEKCHVGNKPLRYIQLNLSE